MFIKTSLPDNIRVEFIFIWKKWNSNSALFFHKMFDIATQFDRTKIYDSQTQIRFRILNQIMRFFVVLRFSVLEQFTIGDKSFEEEVKLWLRVFSQCSRYGEQRTKHTRFSLLFVNIFREIGLFCYGISFWDMLYLFLFCKKFNTIHLQRIIYLLLAHLCKCLPEVT